MRVRIRLDKALKLKLLKYAGLTALAFFVIGLSVFLYLWRSYGQLIDSRMSGEIFDHAARIYSAPRIVGVGQKISLAEIEAQLRGFGYSDVNELSSRYGTFDREKNRIEIRPGEESVVGAGQAIRIETEGGEVVRLTALGSRLTVDTAQLDPAHVTNLFGRDRTKRRLISYEDIPMDLVQALLTAEDRRFFNHPGVSIIDVARVFVYDMTIWLGFRKGARPHGASTLNMQLARSYFLGGDLSLRWQRKVTEAFIALQLDQRFTKEKIFELYSNEIYLGQKGSFSIHGFGEAAQAYFGKDVGQLTLAESALLAGMIRGPNRYNPYRNLDRIVTRRNLILNGMADLGVVDEERIEAAKEEEVVLTTLDVEASDAPYFVDLVRDGLTNRFADDELITGNYRIYTTIDPDLQLAASLAVQETIVEVDEMILARYKGREDKAPTVQVALIALDPLTGAVRALIGGRDYSQSQLNHATARRQPGSAFKPFVFAAAFGKALDEPENAITPVTTVVDEPTVFIYGNGEEYSPGNFGEKFFGVVTAREALTKSLNVATVKIAEMAGYDRVASLAVAAGLDPGLRPTPAMAIGSSVATPLEVAGAYTVFANQGRVSKPAMIETILSGRGNELYVRREEPVEVLDPRVAYLVLDLMVDNLNRGTGAGTRGRGFYAPGAGKTGTSRDAWFVGFTSNLLTVVWLGIDDYSDLGLSGGRAAVPVWAAFMKRAVELPAYRDTEDFIPPEGIVSIPVDPETWQIATPDCPEVRAERFLVGTEPRDLCPLHRPSVLRRFSRALSGALGIRRGRKRNRRGDRERDPDRDDGSNPPPPDNIQPPDPN